jgi:molecular chaperone GrpE
MADRPAPPDATTEPEAPAHVDELETQIVELEDRLRRALADLDNLWKRLAREVARERAEERARVAAAWLPIVDHLELALQHAGSNPAGVLEGVRAVRDEAVALLERLGYPRNEAVGAHFDPTRHEAVSTIADADAEPGTVVHVVRPGYGEGERQLRPASVVVATGEE